MGLFGKSRSDLERENRMLKEMLIKQSSSTNTNKTAKSTSAPKVKKVLYQCRHCGFKQTRNAADGAPPGVNNCPRHPKGVFKGPHSWMRTYL